MEMRDVSKILIAYDGSEGASKGLKAGISLAKVHRAELCALAVEEKPPRFSGAADEVQRKRIWPISARARF